MADPTPAIDLSLTDPATPPGVDFFRHANGGWLDANPVPPEYGSWGAFHEVSEANRALLRELLEAAAADSGNGEATDPVRRMAGDYFAAAMDEAAIAEAGAAPLAPWLERIDAVASLTDLRRLTADVQRIGVGLLHSLGVSPDFEDARAYLVYLGQGGLGLPERDYYLRDDERSALLRDQYVAHVAAQLRNLGAAAEAADGAAARILAFETRLAEASYPAEKLRDVTLTLNRFAVADLDDLMPGFGLRAHAEALGVTSPSVCVDNPGFFTALDAALADTPLSTLRDYARWHLVRAYASALAPAFEEEAFSFYGMKLGGQQAQQPRWKRAIGAASADIGEQVARLYVERAFPESAKRRCEEMVGRLLDAMGAAIDAAAWMTPPTKAAARAKLARFGYKIGYPDSWRDHAGLVIGRDGFADNRMRCAAFEYDREFGRLGQPVDTTEWAMPAHSVNAYYHPLLNEIVFPAGILQPPFFFAEADDAVNYGGIGAVIGHEITHGFDDQGSRFDADGALADWWSDADRAEFDRRAQVLVEQFDGYEVLEGARVNGRLTLGENIADLGGLAIALAALDAAAADAAATADAAAATEAAGAPEATVDGLTPHQRFFLAYAAVWRMNATEEYARLLVNVDPHSPAHFRVNGPLSNLPAFAEAFGVGDDEPMVRPEASRAHVW